MINSLTKFINTALVNGNYTIQHDVDDRNNKRMNILFQTHFVTLPRMRAPLQFLLSPHSTFAPNGYDNITFLNKLSASDPLRHFVGNTCADITAAFAPDR